MYISNYVKKNSNKLNQYTFRLSLLSYFFLYEINLINM